MVAPIILSVVAFVAGHPTAVACDANVNQGPNPPPPGFVVEAWTPYGGNVIHTLPSLCDGSNDPVGSPQFAAALRVFIHEAAHARGVHSETCAEMTADEGVFDVLRRFYGVPFFSPLSERVGAEVLALTRVRPPEYQPELCWRTGTIS